MFVLKAAFCRVYQGAFRLALPLLPYRESRLLHGLNELPKALKERGLARPLIVTDRGIADSGLLGMLETALAGIEHALYDGTQPNPTVSNVEAALEIYRAKGCDCLIALGGGSAIDCAKSVGARIAHPRRSLQQMRGILRVLHPLPPFFAIPTTAGTGSEVTLAAVITDGEKRDKYALMSFPLIPHYAVLDARLTVSLPPHLTASTGMDALTHAVEAFIGRSTTKETRRLALQATEIIFGNVARAWADGADLQARESMLLAAYKAGAAFSKSYVGYIHAIAHSLGGQYGTPHGLANAVIMPHVLRAYGKRAHRKLHALGVAAGVCSAGESHAAGAEKFIEAIEGLNAHMQLPSMLRGIRREDVPALARHAEREANPLYPVPRLMTAAELEEIYAQVADWSEEA